MKITPSTDLATGKAAAQTAPSSPVGARPVGSGATDNAQATGSASIHISDLSAQLHALETSLATGDEFDVSRVEQIKSAIRNGTLSIDTHVIADKILASVQEMLAKEQ